MITIKDPRRTIIIRTPAVWYMMDYDALCRSQWRGGLFVQAKEMADKFLHVSEAEQK